MMHSSTRHRFSPRRTQRSVLKNVLTAFRFLANVKGSGKFLLIIVTVTAMTLFVLLNRYLAAVKSATEILPDSEMLMRQINNSSSSDVYDMKYHANVLAELKKKFVVNPVFDSSNPKRMHGQIGLDASKNPIWNPARLIFKMSQQQKVEAHTGYCFNTCVSKSISLDRDVPDYNSRQCKNVIYPKNLPAASVIIVFYNEDFSVLLRSFHSVLNRTPPHLLHEVILVDDFSNTTTHPWLLNDLDNYLRYVPKVVLRRLDRRHGLMMARMAGVEWSSAPINIFLDSHIEVSDRWIEPLISAVHANPKNIVVPLIQYINFDTFEFQSGYLGVLGFTWILGQTRISRPDTDFEPMPSPIMAGGLFATNKQWFLDLGGYDKEMRLYGGEEMEIGFKTWMCGGEINALPCSRVGHVFRSGKYWSHQVYEVPGEEIHRNKLRVAAVWMDEYKKIAKIAIPKISPPLTLGSLDEAKSIREKLQCKSFKWYLETVYPELHVPKIEGGKAGAIRCIIHNACIDSLWLKNSGETVGAYPCHGQHGSQAVLHDADGFIRLADASFTFCLRAGKDTRLFLPDLHPNIVTATKNCKGNEWIFDAETQQLIAKNTVAGVEKRCLQVVKHEMPKSSYELQVATCDSGSKDQKFAYALTED